MAAAKKPYRSGTRRTEAEMRELGVRGAYPCKLRFSAPITKTRLERLADEHGTSMSALVEAWIESAWAARRSTR